jgi:hypothetical protein
MDGDRVVASPCFLSGKGEREEGQLVLLGLAHILRAHGDTHDVPPTIPNFALIIKLLVKLYTN